MEPNLIESVFQNDVSLYHRFKAVKSFGRTVRTSEYHVTNACNIRCKGCWFFENEFEKKSKENKSQDDLDAFVRSEVARGINSALLIGGEPTLFVRRIQTYVEHMKYVSVSTNGLAPLPYAGFENVQVFISLFGGGSLDDELRAIKPGGGRFTGLFDQALKHYRYDERATFVYAITEAGIEHIEETVRKIKDNGNKVSFNFYSHYDQDDPLKMEYEERLLAEALRVKENYPATVLSTPYYIRAIITGKSHWDSFSYENCPSISVDHPAHEDRLRNGNRALPLFNTYAPDLKTVNFCCTSGSCGDCRDSQALYSWLLVSSQHFMDTYENAKAWVELAESYWQQHVWSPFRVEPKRLLVSA